MNNTTNNTAIIEKIQKLLALANSPNENEVQSAMTMVQKLLMKHKLTMKDIEGHSVNAVEVLEKVTDFTFDYKAKWKGRLANLIADNLGCYCFLKTYRKHTIVFLGTAEDVTICNIMYSYALDCINRKANSIARKMNRQGLKATGVLGDYALGFTAGLHEAFEAQKKEHSEWGLVIQKEPAVIEAYMNKTMGSISLRTKFAGNSEAYYDGVKEGKTFNIADKIGDDGQYEGQVKVEDLLICGK